MRGWTEWAREHFGPPLAGIVFWGFALLIVVMATASAKNSILRDFLAGFGSIAQVAIAYAVWKVSREQLTFTKTFNERQLKLQALPERVRLFKLYLEYSSELYPHKINDDSLLNFTVFTREMKPIYGRETMTAITNLINISVSIVEVKEEYGELFYETEERRAEFNEKMKPLRKPWREAFRLALRAIEDELSLDPDRVR